MHPELAPFAEPMSHTDFGDVEGTRRLRERLAADLPPDPAVLARLEIADHTVGAATVRTYRPAGRLGPLPALLWMHGGGFAVGGVETTHAEAAVLADRVGAFVASVGYRLAPEHPYPAAIDDCLDALSWLADGAPAMDVDPGRIAVGGVSAGACLAAGLTLLARDRGGPAVCFQLLDIPGLDDRLDTPSMHTLADAPGWQRANAELSWRYYLGDLRGEDVPAYAAPARATDLSELPPAYIATAELDPLRDEGILYALRLLRAGVPVELHQFAGTFHGSRSIPGVTVSQRQLDEIVGVLRRALGTDG